MICYIIINSNWGSLVRTSMYPKGIQRSFAHHSKYLPSCPWILTYYHLWKYGFPPTYWLAHLMEYYDWIGFNYCFMMEILLIFFCLLRWVTSSYPSARYFGLSVIMRIPYDSKKNMLLSRSSIFLASYVHKSKCLYSWPSVDFTFCSVSCAISSICRIDSIWFGQVCNHPPPWSDDH